jgi:multisubunit Na+/H+ antiporter MnhB subunit
VLADYRSLDTLIETAVVFAAALACLLILLYRDDPTVR